MSKRVCAVVVTFNRRELLARCLRALSEQVGPQDRILVVDNASSDGTSEMLARDFPHVCVLAMSTNTGGAGGFHAGTKKAFDDGYDYAWLMDDDGMPAPGCMNALLQNAALNRVTIPAQQEDNGRLYGFIAWKRVGRIMSGLEVGDEIIAAAKPVSGRFLFAFVGPMIGRGVIKEVGLPNADFFIWFDDFEYALRIHSCKGLETMVVPSALFRHNIMQQKVHEYTFMGRTSTRSAQAVKRIYYGTRNYFFILLAHERSVRTRRHFIFNQLRSLIGDIIYEPQRFACARARIQALIDGARGNMGKRDL
jgi:rhamnopyranosyl-N-acetylglucosaminyl-diphospho-decaprenol beta-1,3/1,4-galactofuranosyltransferase